MARTTAPLLSFEASGQIAQTQVYATWKGRPYVRRYTIPGNPRTVEQMKTRNAFKWLTDTWKYYPASAVDAWKLYATGLQLTDRNVFFKINIPLLRGKTVITDLVLSPAARSGLIAQAVTVTAGVGTVTVALTAPALPTGWTITQAYAAAIAQQDPATGTAHEVFAATDTTAPWSIDLTGLTAGTPYLAGGWFKYAKPDGTTAYGQSLQGLATPS